MTVRTEICGAPAVDVTRFEDPWKILFCDSYGWITFTIFEQDIITRLELLDELVLEEQCFCFGLDNGVMPMPRTFIGIVRFEF